MLQMSTPKWEVVHKNQRKSKIPQHVNTKSKKKIDPSSMPRIEPAEPVKESATIYDAFIEKQQNHAQSTMNKDSPKHSAVGNGTQAQKKSASKKKPLDRKPERVKLEDIMNEITYGDVASFIEKEQATFPDNPPIWVMDIAAMFNLKLRMVEDIDPVLHGKPSEYPLSLLSTEIQNLVGDIMLQCSETKLSQCFVQLVNDMISDIGKGVSVNGYRMFIQLICRLCPAVVLNNSVQFQDLIKTNQSRQQRSLAVMWAVGQVGFRDITDGLTVWFELMLPFLNVRILASYIVEYLEDIFDCPDNKADGRVSEKNFFHLFDLMHNLQQLSLPGPLQKKLHALYPQVRALALSSGGDGMSKVIFPSFLKRCNDGIKDSMRKEILVCLVLCLKEDKSNFSHWRQVYTKYLAPSGILLEHLNYNWSTAGSQLDKTLLKETVQAFTLTNEDLQKKGKSDSNCDAACKELSARMASRRFSWFWLIVLFFALAAGVLMYDLYVHKSFKASKTRQVLNDVGVLTYLEQAWSRAEYYMGIAFVWLSDNVPYYYGKMSEVLSPYLILFWEKMYAFGEYIVEITTPARTWISNKIPVILEWLDQKLPFLVDTVSYYGGLVLEVSMRYLTVAWGFVSHYTFHAGVWLQENVFKGKLTLADVQETFLSGVQSLWLLIQYSALKVDSFVRNVTTQIFSSYRVLRN